jgi:hypothetical protein
MYTSTLSYVQYYYTRLQIRKASVFAIIPNIVDIQFWHEINMNFITNIIFYVTFFFILYKIKKNLAKLVYIGTESPKYKNNFLFKKALGYFNIVFYTILLLVILSLIWDCTYIFVGELFDRTPLHSTRLFKLFIAYSLIMLNITIKYISGEKITKWDIIKSAFLFIPIVIQSLMVSGYLTFDINILIPLFLSIISNDTNLETSGIKTFFNKLFSRFNKNRMFMIGESEEVSKYNPEDKCILPSEDKVGNIHAMNYNNDGNSESSGGDKGKQPEGNSGSGKGKEPMGISDKVKGKQPAISSDTESVKSKQSVSSSISEKMGEFKFWTSNRVTNAYDPAVRSLPKRGIPWDKGLEFWDSQTKSRSGTAEGSTSQRIKGTTSGTPGPLHTVKPPSTWIPGVPKGSEHANLIDILRTDPDKYKTRPSTSTDRSSSEIGEGTSTARRPASAPERETPGKKEGKQKERWWQKLYPKKK